MPELDCFLGRKEQFDLAAYFLKEGAVLVPSKHYETSKYEEINNEAQFQCARDEGITLFFVISDIFYKSPLEMRAVPNSDNYFIPQRNGGPTIDFSCGPITTKEGIKYIGPSFISYYPSYWNTLSQKNELPPEQLKLFYGNATRYLRKIGSRIKTEKRAYLVGDDAWKLHEQGAKFIGIDV